MLAEYAVPVVPAGNVELLKVRLQPPVGAAFTTRLAFVLEAVPPKLSVTPTVNLNEPLLPQVTPETEPLLLTMSPLGKPALTTKV